MGRMNADSRATFVYDGDCAFCTTCAQFIERRIPTLAHVVPWQFTDLAPLGLTADECEQAVQWVAPDGTKAAGPDAVALLLQDAGRAWQYAGAALELAPVRAAAWPAYRWIAGHRHMMPGGTPACSLPQATRDKLYGTNQS
jgi:predicted DCC family thiol-disulfide oxidoreductase YuxK